MGKISESLKNFRDRIRVSVSVKTQNMLFFTAISLILILSIMIRLTPVVRGLIIIKAFDPWIQYYNAVYLSEHSLYDYFNWHDFKSWYPDGYDRFSLRPGLTFSVVIIYNVLNFIGLPISIYQVCYFFPPFMGGLTVLAMYFFGKEVLDRRCGLLAAFFLAFNTGHIQRTCAGFFDNETIGVFAVLMAFVFFLKAVKTGKILHSIMGGLFLGYLSLSWNGYQYVYLLLPIVCGVIILMNKYDANVLIGYAGVQGTGLLIFSLYYNFGHQALFSSVEVGGIFLFTIVLIIFHLIYTKKHEYPRFYDGLLSSIKWLMIPTAVALAIIIWVNPDMIPFGFGGRIKSVLSPMTRSSLHLTESVAEHMPSAWGVFYYNTLIPFLLLPLGIFFCFRRSTITDVLLIVFLLTIFYFTGSMIRIILLFSPAACLVGAYGLANVLKIYGSFVGEGKDRIQRKRRRQIKQPVGTSEVLTVYFIVGFLCMVQVIHATDISINQLSYSQIVPGVQFHDWEETLTWMKYNLKGTDVVVSWWDYGYWLTPIGNVTTVNDNATVNNTRIGLTGMALMQTNEIYSAKILNHLRADYVLIYFGFLLDGFHGDEGKWQWMLRICNDNYNRYKNWGMEEDNWAENSVFDESEYVNSSTGLYRDKWFESQLVRLMFYGEYTDPSLFGPNTVKGHYATQINQRKDDYGNTWKSHIPDNGAYDFKVFNKAYFSRTGLIKLYKLDYTALDSSFSIKNAKVYDSGYGTFNLENTGTRDLQIEDVKLNGKAYNFTLGKGRINNELGVGVEDIAWVKFPSVDFSYNDVVNVSVTAKADAIEGKTYTFTSQTSEFFVSRSGEGNIKINRENSKVEQISEDIADLYIEVENTGNSIELLKEFYFNSENNKLNASTAEYISGSPILQPGEKAFVHLPEVNATFYPYGTYNTIGVVTSNGISDRTIFSSNDINFKMSILDEARIKSPELIAAGIDYSRNNIPISLSKTHAYAYDNGITRLEINVKNTGDTVFGIDSVYLNETESWNKIYSEFVLRPGEEDTIIMETSESDLFDVNDKILITVTGSFNGDTVASDVGFIHTIKDKPDIQIIKNAQNYLTSYIAANETGTLLIKNTGDEEVILKNVILNVSNTVPINDVNFIYGDDTLGIQECAIISFNIPNLRINISNELFVEVTTYSSAQAAETFTAVVNSELHDISIDDSGTTADIDPNELTIKIVNNGVLDVTLDSIYINNTYIPLADFDLNGSIIIENGGGSLIVSIDLNASPESVSDYIGSVIEVDDILKILARTIEGAEDIHLVTVIDSS